MKSLFRNLAVSALVALFFSGCAGERMFNDGKELITSGKHEEGLSKIEAAIKENPASYEYQVYLKNRKEALIFGALAHAEEARSQGMLTEAEAAYRQVLSLDPRNQPARMGMDKLVVDRRHKQLIAEADELFKKDDIEGAAAITSTVLNENPKNRDAKHLEARIVEKQSKFKKPENRLADSFRKTVSFEFRDAPLRSVFEVIAKVSGINFVYDKDIRPDLKATIFVKNSSVEEAIKLLSVTNQLEFRVLNANSILIYPNTPQKIKDYQPLVVRSFYLANAEAKQVANTLKTLLKTKDLIVNEKLNLLIMRDTVEAVQLAEKIIALEDLNEPEVMLEVEVLEVKKTTLSNLGIKWPTTLSITAPADLPLSELKRLDSDSLTTNLAGMLISARKDDTDVRILANPRIRVKNREKAKVLIGDRVPVITTTSTATGFVADSVSYVDVGLKLEVEPNIFLDEEVSMKIQMEVSSIVNQVISKSGTLSYQIGTRNANTVLRLRDGETQVLAGLINDEDRRGAAKVPGLGDLPLLGRLFSSHNGDAQKTELVLSITPRLVRTIRRPDMINAMFESGTETSLSGKSLSMGASSVDSEKGGVKASQNTANSTQPRNAVNGQGGSASQAKAVAIPDAPQQKELSKPEPKSQSGLSLNWTGPSQVKPGEQFNVTLNIGAESAIAGVAALLGFDPAYLQVVSVSEGDFLKQGGSDSRFSNRIDPVSGKVFLANIRMDGQVTGKGSLAMLSFKAVQATDKASIQLLSMTPETGTGGGDPLNVPMPADLNITVN